MANASNAVSKIGLIKEVTFGTTPATPALISQRFASANFTVSKSELNDDSKTGSRQRGYVKLGNATVTGSISGPAAHDNYDTLLESALFGTWTSNVLKLGSTVHSMSIEEAQTDIGVYRKYNGVIVNGFSIESPAEGLASMSFDVMALGEDVGTTSMDADAYTDQPFREPFVSCGGVIKEGGVTIGYVSTVSLSLNNNLSPAFYWGACEVGDLIPGVVDVTGSLEVYFKDAALMNKFLAGTYSSVEFTLSDGTHTLSFNVPKIMYTGAASAIDAGSGQRMVSLPFKAVYDTILGSSLVVTRSV